MQRFTRLFISLSVVLLLGVWSSSAWALSLSDKAGLQAAMQRHVDRQTVEGVYLYFDTKTGEVEALHPGTAHPVILEMGEYFVLCFDFRDDQGKEVPIDYYLARDEGSFTIFHESVNDRRLLKEMMKDGKISRAD